MAWTGVGDTPTDFFTILYTCFGEFMWVKNMVLLSTPHQEQPSVILKSDKSSGLGVDWNSGNSTLGDDGLFSFLLGFSRGSQPTFIIMNPVFDCKRMKSLNDSHYDQLESMRHFTEIMQNDTRTYKNLIWGYE